MLIAARQVGRGPDGSPDPHHLRTRQPIFTLQSAHRLDEDLLRAAAFQLGIADGGAASTISFSTWSGSGPATSWARRWRRGWSPSSSTTRWCGRASSPPRKGTRCCCPSTCCWWSPAARRRIWGSSFSRRAWRSRAMPAKLFVETLLFFVNFAIQRTFIFHGPEGNGVRQRRTPSGRFYAWLILAVARGAGRRRGLRLPHQPSVCAGRSGLPMGRARLLQFGALYVAAATALLILAPWMFRRSRGWRSWSCSPRLLSAPSPSWRWSSSCSPRGRWGI